MTGYIDYDRLFDAIEELYKFSAGKERKAFSTVLDLINVQPFADVQEVRHGKWGRSILADDFFRCSVCGAVWNRKFEYCPHCGAKMDGGEGE